MSTAGDSRASALFTPQPREVVIQELIARSQARFEGLSDSALTELLEDALYTERKRLHKKVGDDEYRGRLDDLARVLVKGDRDQKIGHGRQLVSTWADEIHGHFDPNVYRMATHILPRGLAALLSGRPRRARDWRMPRPQRRIKVDGPIDELGRLAKEATLVLVPTHVSNLDSPLIGMALHLASLPPFVYGAGLNLFENPILGWWMHRLGAYTVDRLKKARLYKEVLKDYSIRSLTTRHHSLFFPGGTRSRSGAIESKLKKGLMGTGIQAWQEMLAGGRSDSEVYFVPLTLSFQLVLEANTLIEDHLADAGKQRYIITDDEFREPRRLLAFASRVMDLDASCIARFGTPIDCLGNEVSLDAVERQEQAVERRRFVCNPSGEVEWDPQRDRVYTERLATAIAEAYPKYASAMATHTVAYAAWRCLERSLATRDPFRIVRSPVGRRSLELETLLRELAEVVDLVHLGADRGNWHAGIPQDTDKVLSLALDRFGRYHRSRALRRQGQQIVVEDPKLCLYYRNRLAYMER